MPRDTGLTHQILRHIRNERDPGAPCVQFDTSTRIGDHDPEIVLRHVSRLREEGLLEVIEVEVDARERPVEISVRGITAKGEDLLEAS